MNVFALILTITLCCTFIPQIYSLGANVGGINISATDFVLAFNFYFLGITYKVKNIYSMCKQYRKITVVFLIMTTLLCFYLLFSSFFNDFGLVLKLVRTLLYSFFVYLLVIVGYKEKNITGYMMVLSLIASWATILSFRHIVITTGEYSIFRNSETFLTSSLCYLIIWLTLNKTQKLYKVFAFFVVISLIGAIIVEQDRVQIIAVSTSLLLTIIFLLFKKVLSFKKIMRTTFSILLVFGVIYFVVISLNNDGINHMFQNYYKNRIAILFNNNGNFQLDTSLNFRHIEYRDILSSITNNLPTFLFGKGLGATYLGSLTVVDSFWFWIILNMGLLGFLFFAYFFIYPFRIIIKDKSPIKSAPIFAYFCTTFVMTLTIPNMIYRVDDSVSIGIFFGLLHLILKSKKTYHEKNNIKQEVKSYQYLQKKVKLTNGGSI